MTKSSMQSEHYNQAIIDVLDDTFHPQHLSVIDESNQHGDGSKTGTHIRVRIVCEQWEDQSLVARHRQVYNALQSYMQQSLHAVAIEALSSSQFVEQAQQWRLESPDCRNKQQHITE